MCKLLRKSSKPGKSYFGVALDLVDKVAEQWMPIFRLHCGLRN